MRSMTGGAVASSSRQVLMAAARCQHLGSGRAAGAVASRRTIYNRAAGNEAHLDTAYRIHPVQPSRVGIRHASTSNEPSKASDNVSGKTGNPNGNGPRQQKEQQQGSSQSEEDQQNRRRRRQMIGFITWLPALFVFANKVATVGTVRGASMSPTLSPDPQDRDLVVINKLPCHNLDYHIGDVVLLIAPFDPNLVLCKRILAMPGDVVSVSMPSAGEGGRSMRPTEEKMRIQVPPYHVWVEGDNSVRDAMAVEQGQAPIHHSSRDSRMFGPVSMGLITGRVDMVLWPPSRFGTLPDRPYFDTARQRELHRRRQHHIQSAAESRAQARPHPNDSSLSPYTIEREWSTDAFGRKGVRDMLPQHGLPSDQTHGTEGSATEAEDAKSVRMRAREQQRRSRKEEAREQWNRMSRGGRLGDDAMQEEEEEEE